ncbi:MAG: response regulator [Planctomycetota bacterium]|nr:response regulator [Planctomycetota bacterium]
MMEARKEKQGLEPEKILVVDDNEELLGAVSRLLELQGYTALTATSGEEALEMAGSELPDLILLDWILPGIDGIEVCRKLKNEESTRGIMVLLLTGRGSVDSRIEGLDAGADDFIPKPFKHPELLARIRSSLRLKKTTDELTERNRQLVESQYELVRTEKIATIGLLASGIAHEFNNIMAGISGYAQLASKNPKYMPQLVEVALTQARRAQELTGSLSSYNRRGTGNRSCNVENVVQSTLCLVKKELESNGIELCLDIDAVLPAAISPGQLQEVLLNLLINAIHALGSGGKITLEVQPGKSGMIDIRVADTGCGISEENLNRIFDPFFTTKGALGGGEQAGTGLGLSVCYNIIQSRGGRITVESSPAEGTTFAVALPSGEMAAAVCGDEAGPGGAETEACSRDQRILVVDDEKQIRDMLRDFLGARNVSCCCSGEEALEACENQLFDFVLLDICMKNSSNGIETFRALRQCDPALKIILCTGSLPENIPPEVLESCHAHLLKPFKLEDLCATLNATVEA